MRRAAMLAVLPMLAAAQTAPNPNRPTPTFDSVRPELPPLRKPAILVFSKTNSFRHDSIPAAVAAISRLIAARGWSVYATENAAVFNPEQLTRFDAVVFASSSGDVFTPDQRAAFEAFLARGRGFVAIHAAGDGSQPDWYTRILGAGRYTGHPAGKDQFQESDLIILDRAHPATRHLPGRWRWAEEYYSYATPPVADAHILARLDEVGMRLEPRQTMGDQHALIWWRCEGRARIFYSALGHKPETFADPAHLRLIDGAIGWAARRTGRGCD